MTISFPKMLDIKDVKNKNQAKEWILNHVENYPKKHAVPDNLVNTYSGMFGHPMFYCKECSSLIDKFKIKNIDELKKGMWSAYVQREKK